MNKRQKKKNEKNQCGLVGNVNEGVIVGDLSYHAFEKGEVVVILSYKDGVYDCLRESNGLAQLIMAEDIFVGKLKI